MKPYFQDNHVTLYNKSSLDMSEIPDNTIQCCITSPPYWGLRKYAGEQDLIWDGYKGCEHIFTTTTTTISNNNGTGHSTLNSQNGKTNTVPDGEILTGLCSLCGAWRGSFGLEPTPELYIQHSMQFLKEIHRVLRKDGTVFWNLGDSYSGKNPNRESKSLKPKDLCLIPFRFAIAAQEAGWWVRSVIIWSKNNPMPESVRDRVTESRPILFLEHL